MAKEAVLLSLGDLSFVAPMEYARCLYEASGWSELAMKKIFVEDDTELPSLDDVVSILNGEAQPSVVNYYVGEDSVPVSSPSQPQEHIAPCFEGLSDNDRAVFLREQMRKCLVGDLPAASDEPPYLATVKYIFENWNSGLSRGSISRHLKIAADEVRQSGKTVTSSAGRYMVL